VFFLFPAFFPQIISGPIQRPEPFFSQMRDIMARRIDAEQVETGFRFILGGLMLKTLVGDRLGAFIELIDQSHRNYSYGVMLTTVACYTLQLYADFSGYTNIALGIGKLFGIEGPPNFNAPFAVANIQEMWRRWHMSLTLWLTDYLFTPLSMSLRDYGQAGLISAICLNMIIIGVWHGFTLNYLVFGMLHAVFLGVTVLILGELARRKRAAGKAKAPQSLGWRPPGALLSVLGAALTFALMSFSQIFFHSETFNQATSILAQVVRAAPSGPTGWSDMPAYLVIPAWICLGVALYVGAGAPGVRGLFGSLTEPPQIGCSMASAFSCCRSSRPREADGSSMGNSSARSAKIPGLATPPTITRRCPRGHRTSGRGGKDAAFDFSGHYLATLLRSPLLA
jgi:alginate O-acetyltransferase complex protein AlgI